MRIIDRIPVNNKLLQDINYITNERPIAFYKTELYFHQTDRIPWHWHPALQMVLIKEGRACYHVGERKFILESGDGILVNINQLHRYYPVADLPAQEGPAEENSQSQMVKSYSIVFLPEFIAAPLSLAYKKYVEPLLLDEGQPCLLFRQQVLWQKEVLELYQEAFAIEDQEEKALCHELEVHERISAMWRKIFIHRKEFRHSDMPKGKIISQVRMKQMISYIDQHFEEKITLEDIAGAACIGKREALRCFKENMGRTPFSYLMEYRISQGKNKLIYSDDTVVEIALSCGFESASYFNRVFRRYVQMSPLQFRRQMLSEAAKEKEKAFRLASEEIF